MPGVFTALAKGVMINAIDKHLETPTAAKRAALQQVANLVSGTQRLDALKTLGTQTQGAVILPTPGDVKHADDALRDGPTSLWPGLTDKADVFIAGYLKAFDLALAANPVKPIVTYWVIGSSIGVATDPPANDLQVAVAESPQEITVFWMTPQFAIPTPIPPDTQSVLLPIWYVGRRSQLNEIISTYAAASYVLNPTEPIIPGADPVEALRVKGY